MSDPAPVATAVESDQEIRGEERLVVDGVTFRRGDHVRLHPDEGRNAQDHLLDGPHRRRSSASTSTTTDAVHLCVTVDDDPGQDIMRDIGRYLYFKPDEVEVMAGERA